MAKAAYIGVKKKSYSLEVAGGSSGGQVTLTLNATIVECWSSSPVVNGQLTSPDTTGALSAVYRSYSYFRYPDETTFYSYTSQSSGGGSSGAGGGGGGGGSSSSTTSITCQAYELVSSTTSESVARKVKKMYIGVDGVARKIKKAYIGVNGVARLFWAGIPDEAPSQWELVTVITANQTWTPPDEDWYRVHVFGKCGNGSNGGYGWGEDQGNESGGFGGAGGNSGGYACSSLILKDPVECTVNTSITSFGSYLSATSGGSVSRSRTPSSTVGTATGGTDYNLSGYKGGAGGQMCDPSSGSIRAKNSSSGGNNGASGRPTTNDFGHFTDSAGAPGGGGARLPAPYTDFPYVPNSLSNYYGAAIAGGFAGKSGDSYPALDVSAPMLYGGGNGGSGGHGFSTGHGTGTPGNGSEGSPAVIIIERAVY